MKLQTLPDAAAAAGAAAAGIADAARTAVAARGVFILGVSGGSTPRRMLAALAELDLPWKNTHIVQVDERVAPAGHNDRNFTHLRASLPDRPSRPGPRFYPMPVESDDLSSAAEQFAATLRDLAGDPPVLDLVHLGLGADGHTASLVPDDPALEVTDRDVALTGKYQGRSRMTLTYPMLNRARRVLWLVTGGDKADMHARLRAGDVTIPAGRVRRDHACIFADEAATTSATSTRKDSPCA